MPQPDHADRRRAGAAPQLAVAWATALAFGSRLVGQLAGFAAAILVARGLGPAAFGLYA
ncbi:MAG: hypothetical protein HGA45_44895, partial [Chloroflexales bacterium]|nr:hypothetical protein [Chloroflexales bacterium]